MIVWILVLGRMSRSTTDKHLKLCSQYGYRQPYSGFCYSTLYEACSFYSNWVIKVIYQRQGCTLLWPLGTEGLLSLLVQNEPKILSCQLIVNVSRVKVFTAGNICIVLFWALIPCNQTGPVRIWSYTRETRDLNVVCAGKRWEILSIRLLPLSSKCFLTHYEWTTLAFDGM